MLFFVLIDSFKEANSACNLFKSSLLNFGSSFPLIIAKQCVARMRKIIFEINWGGKRPKEEDYLLWKTTNVKLKINNINLRILGASFRENKSVKK